MANILLNRINLGNVAMIIKSVVFHTISVCIKIKQISPSYSSSSSNSSGVIIFIRHNTSVGGPAPSARLIPCTCNCTSYKNNVKFPWKSIFHEQIYIKQKINQETGIYIIFYTLYSRIFQHVLHRWITVLAMNNLITINGFRTYI